MPIFSYKATNTSGKIVQDSLEAEDMQKVAAHLQEMGLIPIRIRPAGMGGARFSSAALTALLQLPFRGVSSKEVLLFTQDLSTLLSAGLPVDRALTIMINTVENDPLRDVVRDILQTVQGGASLSEALSRHPKTFSRFYINMVRAGETGGVLDAVLERMGLFLEDIQELQDSIKSALIYPLFVVSVGGVSIIILMTFIIPKFSIIFADMGGEIPLTTRLLLGMSHGLRTYWPLMVLVLGGIIFFLRRFARTPAGRLRLDTWKLQAPLFGELTKKLETARFARTLGTLLQSGVPILQALSLVQDILSNTVMARSMESVRDRVKKGDRLSEPLHDAPYFPALAVQMITVGEETGTLDIMLLKVADNYEKIVNNLVKRAISLLEPALILIMGLVVGFIVISMLLAIFSINDLPL